MSGAQDSEQANLERENRRVKDEIAAQASELAALQARFARYETALRGSQVTVYIEDRELRYTSDSNPIAGRSIDEIIGRTGYEVFPQEGAAAVTAAKRGVLE